MISFTARLLFPLALAACAGPGETGQQAALESGQIVADGVPDCLHVGDSVEVLVSVDASGRRDDFNLAVSATNGIVSATLERANGLAAPTAVIFRGERFGEDSITISVPSRPDIIPLTANIRVLPSFEPPQGLSTHPTDKFSHPVPDAENDPNILFRVIIYRWRPKEGVKDYAVATYNAERRKTEGSLFSARGNRGMAWVTPGESHFWRIRAKIDTCDGGEAWTRYSPFIPFDG